MRLFAAPLIVMLGLAAPMAPAQQAETLADLRQDIAVLNVELQRLKQELNTTGSSGTQIGGGAVLDRVNAIESELQRVTGAVERLQFRIEKLAKDGTNRLGDLEFRVCEVQPGCDIGNIAATRPLGSDTVPDTPVAVDPGPVGSDLPVDVGQLAVSEEADFLAAQAALEASDFLQAGLLYAQFRDTYPGGPLEAAALVGEGRALEGQGDMREAARRYLSAYSGYGDDPMAPEALWRLGTALAALGSLPEACVTLSEVGGRYPGASVVAQAEASRAELACQ